MYSLFHESRNLFTKQSTSNFCRVGKMRLFFTVFLSILIFAVRGGSDGEGKTKFNFINQASISALLSSFRFRELRLQRMDEHEKRNQRFLLWSRRIFTESAMVSKRTEICKKRIVSSSSTVIWYLCWLDLLWAPRTNCSGFRCS